MKDEKYLFCFRVFSATDSFEPLFVTNTSVSHITARGGVFFQWRWVTLVYLGSESEVKMHSFVIVA